MLIFGIDPGVSGAISILKSKKVIEIYDMPTMIDGKKNKKRWKNIVDKKNEELGWFDLGNHIIIIGVILFAIFIAKNA